jgi:AcrR family transcriptional regulator
MMATTTRQTAEERRSAVLDAATKEFAAKGYHGASTDDIARAAGISQPYLFRLFGTKKDLYLATVQRSTDELYALFAGAAEGKRGKEALYAMAEAYQRVMQDRTRVMLALTAWSTGDDPDVRRVSRAGWRDLVDLVERSSGVSPEDVSRFFASGMLITILTAIGMDDEPEPWSKRLIDACWAALRE